MSRDASAVPCLYVQRPDQLPAMAAAFAAADRIAIDTETPIDGPMRGQMRVLSAAVRTPDGSEQAFVVDARDVAPHLLAPILTGVTADAWQASFDAAVIDAAVWSSADTTPHLTWWDGLLADALLYQGRSGFAWFHGLAWATEHYLGVEATGKGTVQVSFTADTDLTGEQVAYAAADAVHTMWVCDEIRRELTVAGLDEVCEIELEARPFLDQMERSGLPFDWDGWKAELDAMEERRSEVLSHLALLTGGGQGSLFDTSVEPTWNPASDTQVRDALNRWAEPEVLAWTANRFGQSRHLRPIDSVTATVLREIGGELCTALLEFRSYTKTLSTYGESIHEHLHDDGRLHPKYLQVVGTNTGRLASHNPNAQNFTAAMKPYFRPASDDRVFVYADLSQAELRYLAQVADDEPLRAAFARGEDVHVSTAASMFGFDPADLAVSDPDRFKQLRQFAKALNFGIAYGTGAAALARSLTAEGSPTTREEAEQLLKQYRQTYPGTAAWARGRIGEIDGLSREAAAVIDWPRTMRLARGWGPVAQIRREFRQANGRRPSLDEILAAHPDRLGADDSSGTGGDPVALREEIEWLLGYSAPVALLAGGEPFTFASRTLAGRRQQFNLHVERLFLEAVLSAVGQSGADLAAVRRRFEITHGLDLDPGREEAELARQFDDRPLRRLYIEAIAAACGAEVAERFLARAARNRVSAMVNAWRNAPIQGGVADIMLVAYADLHRRLQRYERAVPVQTVHDSVTIECSASDAPAIVAEVKESLEQASLRFCPDVTPAADVDIRPSLANP